MLSDDQFRQLLGIGMIKKKPEEIPSSQKSQLSSATDNNNFLTSLLQSDTLEEFDDSFGMSQTTQPSSQNDLSKKNSLATTTTTTILTHNMETSPILTNTSTTHTSMEEQIDKAFDELTQNEDFVMISTPKRTSQISVNNVNDKESTMVMMDNQDQIEKSPQTPPPLLAQEIEHNKENVWDESEDEVVEQTPPRTSRKRTPKKSPNKKQTTPKKKSSTKQKVETSSDEDYEEKTKKRKSPSKSKKSPSKKTKKAQEEEWDEKYNEEIKKLQQQFASIDKTHLERYEVSNLQQVHFSDMFKE